MSEKHLEPRRPQRRFIAGAVCPDCGRTDSLCLESIDSIDWRRCVDCGFREPRPGADPIMPIRFTQVAPPPARSAIADDDGPARD